MAFYSRSSGRQTLLAAAAFASLTLAAPRASAQPKEDTGRYRCSIRVSERRPAAEEQERKGEERRRRRRGRASFSARDVSDLEIRARIRSDVGAPQRVELKIYTPKGHLYQILPMAFEDKSNAGDRELWTVSATLPLAGTTIVNNALYGRWKALVHVHRRREPCSPPHHFAIEP